MFFASLKPRVGSAMIKTPMLMLTVVVRKVSLPITGSESSSLLAKLASATVHRCSIATTNWAIEEVVTFSNKTIPTVTYNVTFCCIFKGIWFCAAG
jgi:hypothetical protein